MLVTFDMILSMLVIAAALRMRWIEREAGLEIMPLRVVNAPTSKSLYTKCNGVREILSSLQFQAER